jgi:CubicO group peptidase (beta-lactamase class C family)
MEGTMSLDTGLAEIWPGRLAGSRIDLAQLATHTAGLPRQIPDDALAGNDEAALLSAVDTASEAGGEAAYSNTGMAILARALAARTGETPAANLQRLVAAPLGLADTGFEPADAARLAHPHLGRTDIAGTRPATVSIARGAGGLYSTPRDLLRFVEQHLAPQDEEIASLVNTVLEGADGHPLGWQVHDDGARRIFHHSGDANGYQVFVGFRRDTATGVVLLANSSAEDGLQQIALHLLDSAVPLPAFGPSGDAAASAALDRYAGEYVVEGDTSGNRIAILATADGLIYVETGLDGAPVRRAPLVERQPGVFRIRGAPIVLDFETGEAGVARLTAGETEFRMLRQD